MAHDLHAFLVAPLPPKLWLMRVETARGDRQHYRLFYLQRLAQPRGKWSPVSNPAIVFIVLKWILCASRT